MKIFELLKRVDTGKGAALLLFLSSGSSFFLSPFSTDLKNFLPTAREVNTISWFKDLGKGLYPFGVLLVEEFSTFKVLIMATFVRFIGIFLIWLTVGSYITVTQPLLLLSGLAFGASSAELVIRHFLRQSFKKKKNSKDSLKHFLIIATSNAGLSPSFLNQFDLKIFENVAYKRLLMLAAFPCLITIGLSPVISSDSKDDAYSAFVVVAVILAVILAVKPFTEADKKTNVTLTILIYSLWISNVLIGFFYSNRKKPEEEIPKIVEEQKRKSKKERFWNWGKFRVLCSIEFILMWAAGAVGIAVTTSVIDNLRLVSESLSNQPTNLNKLVSLSAFSNFLGKLLSSYFSLFLLKKKISPSLTLFVTLFISSMCLAFVAFPFLLLNTFVIFFFISLCHGAQLMLVSMIFKHYFKKIFYFSYSILRLSVPVFTYLFKMVILSSFYEKSAIQQVPPFEHTNFKNSCLGSGCFQKTFTIFSVISGAVAFLWVIVFILERKKSSAEENKG